MATAPAAEKIMPAVDTKNDPDGFAVKETNCVNTRCLKNNLIYAEEFHEVKTFLRFNFLLCMTETQFLL